MVSTKLLAQYEFLNEEGIKLKNKEEIDDWKKFVEGLDNINDYVEQEVRKINDMGPDAPTGYPKSLSSYRLIYESETISIEEAYFWTLTELTVGSGNFKKENIDKITDVFSASSLSTTFGTSSQRLGIQQDKGAQYLKLISDMTKSMFQLVGDLNKVDEKMGYYKSTFSDDEGVAQDGEYILKGQYVDLVEGGAKATTSVFGMANEVGFSTLPDLFFKLRFKGKKWEDVEKKIPAVVNKLEFGNNQFKRVLQMKLSQYYRWKFKAYNQLVVYRKLYLGYLRQHYNNIKLYMNWVKPYLRNVKRLAINQEKADSPSLISAFEGNLIEIELLAKNKLGSHYEVILVNFDFNAMPKTSWDPRYQQNKVGQVGRMELNIKSYAWTKKQIDNYKAMKDAENLELIKEIDDGMRQGMEAIEETVLEYLNEKEDKEEESVMDKYEIKGGKLVKKKKNNKKGNELTAGSILEPFTELLKSFSVFTEPFKSIKFSGSKNKKPNDSTAKKLAQTHAWLLYKIYKKSHRLMAW